MDQDSHTGAASKVPMLKPGQFELYRMRIEQYIWMIDHVLWEVIENGNTAPKTTVVEGVEKVMPPTTAEEKAQKRLEVKARSTLMMGIPNEHQLMFNSIKDAKLLMEAVEKRFGGNAATKKTKRNLLKPQYENFTAPSSEMLNQTFNRLQKLVSQLELLGETISQEDVNQKLLRSLSPEWNTHVVVWRNKTDLDTMSMDDLLTNKLRFLKNTGMMLTINGNESIGFDSPKLECYILPQKRTFANQCISDQAEEGPNYALMAYSSSSSDSEETSCTPHLNFIFTGLDEFVNKPIVENIKSDEEVSKVVRKSNDSLIIEDWVLDSEEENLSQTKTEKKTKIDTIVAFGGNPKEGNHRKRIPLKLKQKPRKPKRKDTQIPQSSGPTEHVADKAVYKELDDSLVRAATTASSLEAEQDSGNINKTQSKVTLNEPSSLGTSSGSGPRCQDTMGDTIAQTRFENVSKLFNDPLLARANTLRSGEDSLKLNELMELCTSLQQRVLDLETTKTTQANEIASLKRRVKTLKRKIYQELISLKRLYKVGLSARVESSRDEEDLGEDASKQGRINAIDANEDITLVNDQDDADMFDVNTLTGDKVLAKLEVVVKDVNLTVDEVTLAQALADLKSVKPKVKANVVEEPSVPISAANTKDKGKGIMVEEPVKYMKKKDLVRLDEEIASKLQAEFDEEERLAREKDEANVALTEEWDDIQAKVDVDYQLAQRLQAGEQEKFTTEQKATLFKELLEQRRKHFAVKRAEEKRNKPPTQAQQRKICEVDNDQEAAKIKELMEIIPDKEEVAIDSIPLAVKP
ncbi:hypothetical protein Tco_0359657 [Tanacetum coccineum]